MSHVTLNCESGTATSISRLSLVSLCCSSAKNNDILRKNIKVKNKQSWRLEELRSESARSYNQAMRWWTSTLYRFICNSKYVLLFSAVIWQVNNFKTPTENKTWKITGNEQIHILLNVFLFQHHSFDPFQRI